MWTRYIYTESEFINSYLADLVNVESKQNEACVFLKDILVLSNILNFDILKPELLKASKGLSEHEFLWTRQIYLFTKKNFEI